VADLRVCATPWGDEMVTKVSPTRVAPARGARKEVPVAGGIMPTSLLPVSECPGVRVPEDHVRGRDLLRAIVSCLFCRTLSVHPLAGRDIWQQPKPIRYDPDLSKRA